MTAEKLQPKSFLNPAILLAGTVDDQMYAQFREQLENAPAEGVIAIELSTLGGDPEIARMIGEDMRFHSETDQARSFVFLGKTAVYSAGVTLMSFFARENRYLTRGTRLMVHERQMHKQLAVEGPLTSAIEIVRASLHEIEASIAIQNEGFENLIRGSRLTMDELLQKTPSNWYLDAQEAKDLGLVTEVI
ncbi:ClpP family protease [Sphingomonas sp.]|uniref:ClpP family protease n=1 Tax=Sphingomonas sp. TaxID=28214 RepID=UPI003B3A670B